MSGDRSDFTSNGLRSREVGLKASETILAKWGLNRKEIEQLLLIRETSSEVQSSDNDHLERQLKRISFLLNMHAVLRQTFENPDNLYGFMGRSNQNPPFNGQAPFDLLLNGDDSAFSNVFLTLKRMFLVQ